MLSTETFKWHPLVSRSVGVLRAGLLTSTVTAAGTVRVVERSIALWEYVRKNTNSVILVLINY